MEGWRFEKIPKEESSRIKELVLNKDFKSLFEIHNKYGLSDYDYCCPSVSILKWFEYAINEGII
jgi:hypothetical protein